MSAVTKQPSAGFVDVSGRDAQALRNLRVSAERAPGRRGSVALLITGAHPRDGTSTVAANHALVASASGRSTLLVDANVSRPSLDRRLGVERGPGLVDVAEGVIALEDAVRAVRVGGTELVFLTAGSVARGTVDVMGLSTAVDLIGDACRMFDVVVIDSAPILALTDTAVLAGHPEVDTIVVVARGQRRKRVTETISQLERVGANVIGLVVNAG